MQTIQFAQFFGLEAYVHLDNGQNMDDLGRKHTHHTFTLSNVFLDVIDCPKISLFELVEAFGGHSDGQNNENTRERWAKC